MLRRLLLAALLLPAVASAQVTIASQGFEGTAADTWTIASGANPGTASGNVNGVSTATGAGEFPTAEATPRIRTGAASYQAIRSSGLDAAGITLELAPQSVTGYTDVRVILHVSSTSTFRTTTGQTDLPDGADTSDFVKVTANVDGAGFPASPDIQVNGSGNAYWGYSQTQAATVAGMPIVRQPGGTAPAGALGNNRFGQGDDYSTLVISIPDGASSVALRVQLLNSANAERWNVDDIEVVGTPTSTNTAVQFAAASASVTEGTDATFALGVELFNPSATAATTADVVLTSGDPADLGGYVTQTVTFPAGSSAPQTVTLTITDDALAEGAEAFTFALQNVQGGTGATATGTTTFALTITDDDFPAIVINEIDAAQEGNDNAEYVELYDGGVGNQALDGLVVVFYDGADNASYQSYDLDGFATNAQGYFTLCGNPALTPNCDFDAMDTDRWIQDGPDAIAVHVGDASAFPNNTPITTTGLLDAVVYDTNNNPPNTTLLGLLGETMQVNEDANGRKNIESIQRQPDGSETIGPVGPLTPGAANVTRVAQSVFDGAGWRMLSTPVDGVTVGQLATVNLVQGVAGQYPAFGPNLFLGYAGGGDGSFVPATAEAEPVEPGRGFLWYFYDNNDGPYPPDGTSRSYELSTFALATGGQVLTTDVQRAFGFNADGFYLVGNPFARALGQAGVSLAAGDGTLGTNFQVYNPDGGTYELLVGDAAPWQGFFAEVAGGTTAPTVAYSYAATTAGTPPLVGRGAAGRLALTLTGETASGTVTDRAFAVRWEDDAELGWDRHDASKMVLPGDARALLAARGDRLGETVEKAVESLPADLAEPHATPVAVLTTQAGAYTVAAASLGGVPAGWAVELRDLLTGTRADLTAGESLAFTAEASADWSERFVLVASPDGGIVAAQADPALFEVSAVAPNPTAGAAQLTVRVGTTQSVRAAVYDALGRQVALLHDGPVAAGAEQALALETARLAPGAYVVRVQGAGVSASHRFTVVR